jgi:hypothetical protein
LYIHHWKAEKHDSNKEHRNEIKDMKNMKKLLGGFFNFLPLHLQKLKGGSAER